MSSQNYTQFRCNGVCVGGFRVADALLSFAAFVAHERPILRRTGPIQAQGVNAPKNDVVVGIPRDISDIYETP